MNEIGNFVVDKTVQCWACPVFDRLFSIVSDAGASMYKQLTFFGIIIFCVLFAFYVVNVVLENTGIKKTKDSSKKKEPDPLYLKSIKPVIIKSLLVLSLLGMGLQFPKLISRITFEPVALVTLQFSKSMLPPGYDIKTDYTPIKLSDEGFFNPQLRDSILELVQISITNFQVYIKMGIGIIDSAFSMSLLDWISSIVKHIIVCIIAIFLTYNFAKLFIKYSFCFLDIILAMAMFAFFFPISLIFFVFKDASNLPDWMKKLGSDLGLGQIKGLINAIVSVASTILTYTIIMIIIRGYLTSQGTDLTAADMSYEELFDFDLENSSVMQITLAGSIVLVYVINYISNQIPEITKKIMDVFNLSQNDSVSKQVGESTLKLTGLVLNNAKNLATTIINHGSENKNENKTDTDKKEDKKA